MDSDQLIAKFEYILSGDLPEETTLETVKHLVRDATIEWLQNVDDEEFHVITCQQIILVLKTRPPCDSLPRLIIQQEFLEALETFLIDEKGMSVH